MSSEKLFKPQYLWIRTWKNCGALCVCIPTHWHETIPIPSICVFVKNSQYGYRVDTQYKPLMAKTDLGSWTLAVLHNVDITNLYTTRGSVFWYAYWFQSAAERVAQSHYLVTYRQWRCVNCKPSTHRHWLWVNRVVRHGLKFNCWKGVQTNCSWQPAVPYTSALRSSISWQHTKHFDDSQKADKRQAKRNIFIRYVIKSTLIDASGRHGSLFLIWYRVSCWDALS